MDKAAIKRAYKETKRPMGVFGIRNTQTGKIYLGSGKDLPALFNRHKSELKFGSHRNRELQQAWKDLGEGALSFEVLDRLEPEGAVQSNPDEELKLLLDLWFQKLEAAGEQVVRL